MIRFILEQGVDVNYRCACCSVLHCAIRHRKNADLVQLLLEAGADVESSDGDGNTPLNFAARSGDIRIATLLLDYGADINARTERGYTPLYFARNARMAEFLKTQGEKSEDRGTDQ